MASAYCERLIGTIRRECLDYLIPLNQRHLRRIVKEFVHYYNRGRPHYSLAPGIPEPPQVKVPAGFDRHNLPIGYRVSFVRIEDGKAVSYEPFAAGWLKGSTASGRPADVLVMPDGALLVSDDEAGAVYRITYAK